MKTRVKRKHFAMLLCLVALLLIGRYAWQRIDAVECIEHEHAKGLYCEWHLPFDGVRWPYNTTWARYLPGAEIVTVGVDYHMTEPLKLGEALRRTAALKKLSIGQGEPQTIVPFLVALGDQPSLRELYIFNVELPNSASMLLGHFKALRELAIVPSGLDGEAFPLLAEIETIDLSYSPITDVGLSRILASPRLQEASFSSSKVTMKGLLDLQINSLVLREVSISKTVFGDADIRQIAEQMKRSHPSLLFEVTN